MRHVTPLLAALPFAIALAGCDTPTAAKQLVPGGASRAVVVNERVETPVFTFSGCNGDFISGSATFHSVVGVTV